MSNNAFLEELSELPEEQALVSKLMKHKAKRYSFTADIATLSDDVYTSARFGLYIYVHHQANRFYQPVLS